MTDADTRGDRLLEMFAAALMSIATVATAWCAYQSAEWGGEQAFLLGESQRAGREADLYAALAAQKRNLAVAVFREGIDGIATDHDRLTEFYAERFPPNRGIAVEAWLATEPRTNPDAPPHPVAMEDYQGRRMRTYEVGLELMAEEKLDLSPLLTHRFKLSEYKQAFRTLTNRGQSRALKAVFTFD